MVDKIELSFLNQLSINTDNTFYFSNTHFIPKSIIKLTISQSFEEISKYKTKIAIYKGQTLIIVKANNLFYLCIVFNNTIL